MARAALSERQRAAAVGAQAALFGDLRSFGDALGVFGVVRRERSLGLRFERRELRFEAIGDTGVVRVRGSRLYSGAHRLLFAPDGDRWLLSTTDRDGRERFRPLFDEGLEELMDRVFALRATPPEEAAAGG